MKKTIGYLLFGGILPLVTLAHFARHPTLYHLLGLDRLSREEKKEAQSEKPVITEQASPPVEQGPPVKSEVSDGPLPDFDELIPAQKACRIVFPNTELEYDLCGIPTPFQKVLDISLKFRDYLDSNGLLTDKTLIQLIDQKDDGFHRHVLNYTIYPAYADFEVIGNGSLPGTDPKEIPNLLEKKRVDFILVLDTDNQVPLIYGEKLEPLRAYKLESQKITKCWQY